MLYKNVIKQSHFRGLGMTLVFLDIFAAFALFCRLAINLLIIVILFYNIVLPFFLLYTFILSSFDFYKLIAFYC